jgi:hypothetical protein
MALEDELSDDEAGQSLVAWEVYAAAGVAEQFQEAARIDGYTAAALRRAQTGVTGFVRGLVSQVMTVGTAIASSAWRKITGRRPVVRRRGVLTANEAPPTPAATFDQQLEQIISLAEQAMSENPELSEPIYNRANTSTQNLSRSEVNRTAAIAAELAAHQLGAEGVIWASERDACVHCIGLAGEVARFGEPFPAVSPYAEKQLAWRGYNGRPPRHPSCRCRCIPWDGTDETTHALKREAERSVARGWSLPTESNAARLRALNRLLQSPTLRLPPSVIRRARQALADRNFPQGRNFPGNDV